VHARKKVKKIYNAKVIYIISRAQKVYLHTSFNGEEFAHKKNNELKNKR
jgi:hypothetical protein